jgi:hypothetical protein
MPIKLGAVGASAHAPRAAKANPPRSTSRDSLAIETNPPKILNRAGVALARSNAYHLRKVEDEDFSIPHLAGLS